MRSGFHSRYVDDALLRRQLDVERLKTGLQREHLPVVNAVYHALVAAVAGLSTKAVGNITKRELATMVRTVLKTYDVESAAFTSRVTDWLEEYTNQEAAFAIGVVDDATEAQLPVVGDVWPLVAGGIIGATGLTLKKTLSDMNANQRGRITQLLQRAYVQNWSASQIIRAFRGTVTLGYRNGMMHKLGNMATNTLHTVVQFSQSAARSNVFAAMAGIVIGYTWVSILDSSTSKQCRSLSGRFFKFGSGPIPPLHYRCRSHLSPVFNKRSLTTNAADIAVSAGESYYQWLTRQPRTVQNNALGDSWAQLFRRGGLSPDEFAARVLNTRYEPLTLAQLKKRAPTLFTNAGL